MKTGKYEFQWFEKEDRRRSLRASVGRDGKFRLGKVFREELPPYIQIGFDAKLKVLAVADGHGGGIDWPRCGTLSAERLSAQIMATGLKLPVAFRMEYDKTVGYWLGRVIPRRRRKAAAGGALQYDVEQLMALYQHVLDSAVQQMAKSTPLAERRAFVTEEFCAAAQEYRPGFGDMEEYLSTRIRARLLRENRQFTAAYGDRSLDRPLRSDGESEFCLYDVVPDVSAGGIDEVEERIAFEEFKDSLSPTERRLLEMSREGYAIEEIGRALGMAPEALLDLGEEIGRKRREFYCMT